jgi:hypothetical protein
MSFLPRRSARLEQVSAENDNSDDNSDDDDRSDGSGSEDGSDDSFDMRDDVNGGGDHDPSKSRSDHGSINESEENNESRGVDQICRLDHEDIECDLYGNVVDDDDDDDDTRRIDDTHHNDAIDAFGPQMIRPHGRREREKSALAELTNHQLMGMTKADVCAAAGIDPATRKDVDWIRLHWLGPRNMTFSRRSQGQPSRVILRDL